jgi:hypothetical protein
MRSKVALKDFFAVLGIAFAITAEAASEFYYDAARIKAEVTSEVFEEPGVGTAASLPDGNVASIGRGDSPAEFFLGFLKDDSGISVQVHV